jgi:hypothetical protein
LRRDGYQRSDSAASYSTHRAMVILFCTDLERLWMAWLGRVLVDLGMCFYAPIFQQKASMSCKVQIVRESCLSKKKICYASNEET